jgi:hypothetical protein
MSGDLHPKEISADHQTPEALPRGRASVCDGNFSDARGAPGSTGPACDDFALKNVTRPPLLHFAFVVVRSLHVLVHLRVIVKS